MRFKTIYFALDLFLACPCSSVILWSNQYSVSHILRFNWREFVSVYSYCTVLIHTSETRVIAISIFDVCKIMYEPLHLSFPFFSLSIFSSHLFTSPITSFPSSSFFFMKATWSSTKLSNKLRPNLQLLRLETLPYLFFFSGRKNTPSTVPPISATNRVKEPWLARARYSCNQASTPLPSVQTIAYLNILYKKGTYKIVTKSCSLPNPSRPQEKRAIIPVLLFFISLFTQTSTASGFFTWFD